MKYAMRSYQTEDFIRVRDFLVETYAHFRRPYNWTLERWNFAISLARTMHNISLDVWESQIGIWEEEGMLLSVVNTEGEDAGEAFFQVAREILPLEIVDQMFSFCEAKLGKERENGKAIYLRVPFGNTQLEEVALRRGYVKQAEIEKTAALVLSPEQEIQVDLAEGFTFIYGDQISAEEKGEAHARAFGYAGNPIYRERAPVGYRRMSKTPDYRPEFDIYAISPDDEIAAFATLWCDERNGIAILEPVGTIPKYRKTGLGRAAIMQLAKHAQQLGINKLYVGSTQVFYQRLGFQHQPMFTVWEKLMPKVSGISKP